MTRIVGPIVLIVTVVGAETHIGRFKTPDGVKEVEFETLYDINTIRPPRDKQYRIVAYIRAEDWLGSKKL